MKKTTLVLGLIFLTPSLLLGDSSNLTLLMDRAHQFEKLGLLNLAREQYLFIKRQFPKTPQLEETLQTLHSRETQAHLKQSARAKEWGALKVASLEMEQAARLNPSDSKIKKLHSQIKKELALRDSLRQRVSKDFLAGLDHYQHNRFDRALESFVKVLNMDPQHRGALAYIERVGQKLEVNRKP